MTNRTTLPNADQLKVPAELKLYIDAKLSDHVRQLQALHAGINHKLAALSQLEAELTEELRACQARLAKMEDKLNTDPSYKITKSMLIKVAKDLGLEG